MTYKEDPVTGNRVSLLSYGMLRLPVIGGRSAMEDPNAEIDQEMVNRQVDYAISRGVNLFDTSPLFCNGRSERATGIALSRHSRDEYLIATKLSNFAHGMRSPEASKQMFENSLRELQVDYVDYLMMHGVGLGAGALEAFYSRYMDNGILDWLVEQKHSGRIRSLGFSYHGDAKIFDMLMKWHDEGRYKWDFVMIELNYIEWHYASELNPHNVDSEYLYNELYRRGIPVMLMGPLLGGKLMRLPAHITEQMKLREPKLSVSSWAFRFAGTPEGILTVPSGMTYMSDLEDNLSTFSPLKPISADEADFLEKVAKEYCKLQTIPCTGCNYCFPCPQNIDIAKVLMMYSNSLIDSSALDKALIDQAQKCLGCGICTSKCTQQIDIAKQMQRIANSTETNINK